METFITHPDTHAAQQERRITVERTAALVQHAWILQTLAPRCVGASVLTLTNHVATPRQRSRAFATGMVALINVVARSVQRVYIIMPNDSSVATKRTAMFV